MEEEKVAWIHDYNQIFWYISSIPFYLFINKIHHNSVDFKVLIPEEIGFMSWYVGRDSG